MRVAVLDIGGTYTKYGVSEEGFTLGPVNEHPTMAQKGVFTPDYLYTLCDAMRPFEGIAISATGMLDATHSFVRNRSSGQTGYDHLPIGQLLAERYGTPAIMSNDVDCAAVAEGELGAAQGTSDFLCITYGTGVGAGLVLNGALYSGVGGSAGEIGHLVTHGGGRPCTCGNRGCYEQYASVTALVRQVEAETGEALDGRQIFERLRAGDEAMQRRLLAWVNEIGHGLVSLVRVFDIQLLVLGGGIMREDWLIERIDENLSARLHTPLLSSCYQGLRVAQAQAGNRAGMLGALIQFRRRHNS